MRKIGFVVGAFLALQVTANEKTHSTALVIPHAGIPTFELRGNKLEGLATNAKGSKQFEVWHASIAPNSSTPPHHWHETDEVFIFLKGKGKALVGDVETSFEAPCTVVLPAKVPHQVFNTGDIATDHFVVIGSGSKIFDQNNVEMKLPWRE